MKKLTSQDFREIRLWIYRNARDIELALWKYYFENGSREAVVSSLMLYQNADGGFGHALEADNWNPNSSPYTTMIAINILQDIHFDDKNHPVIQGIFRFLESGCYCSAEGWYFNIPSNDAYAHAPWWTFDMEANAVEGIGVTAGIIAFIFEHADENSELYGKALRLTEVLINKLMTSEKFGDMGIGGYCILLDSIEKAKLTERFDCGAFTKRLKKAVDDSIQRDASKWTGYTVRPSDYIHSPQSRFYADNESIVSMELDYLIETRPANGVWNITWSWFDYCERYAKEFAISENWWKAGKAIEKMKYLRSFGCLADGIQSV